jgi:hypothetical protein
VFAICKTFAARLLIHAFTRPQGETGFIGFRRASGHGAIKETTAMWPGKVFILARRI